MPDKFDPQLRDLDDKPGPRPAASYALLYPRLVELVRPLGYALALHGSMNRDFDMVAIPWTDEAVEPEKVAATICEAVGGYTGWDNEPGKPRPHGRRCWLIWFQGTRYPFGGGACIDLSIMPRMPATTPRGELAELEAHHLQVTGALTEEKAALQREAMAAREAAETEARKTVDLAAENRRLNARVHDLATALDAARADIASLSLRYRVTGASLRGGPDAAIGDAVKEMARETGEP